MPTHGLYINGKWKVASSTFRSLNPTTGKILGRVSVSQNKDVEEAVFAARKTLDDWREENVGTRIEILKNVSAILRASQEKISSLITREMGKPIFESVIEVEETVDIINWFADNAEQILSHERVQLDSDVWPHRTSTIIREPVGVVGIIKPWNYPLELPFWSIAAAFAAGNTVVFKPSELTPFVGIEIAKIFEEAKTPQGVFNLVTGGRETGKDLVASDVDMISFTGGREAGKNVKIASGKKFHKLSVELGGSDPFIVLEDANLEEAVNGALWGRFSNCGQVCVSGKRIFVHEKINSDFTAKLTEEVKSLKPGNPLSKDTDIGPMVNNTSLETVHSQITEAVETGAKLVTGGRELEIPELEEGSFYQPTILTNAKSEMRVMKEEVFGPAAVISPFSSKEEAVRKANKTYFGLGASVWTQNVEKAKEISSKLQCGMVWINDINLAFPGCPWGGLKESGSGKELGKEGLMEYVNSKHVHTNENCENTRDWWFPYKRR